MRCLEEKKWWIWSVTLTPGRMQGTPICYLSILLCATYISLKQILKIKLFKMIKMSLDWRLFEGLFPLCILTFLNMRWVEINNHNKIIIIFTRIIAAMKAATRRHNNISSLKRWVKYNKHGSVFVNDKFYYGQTLLKISPLMLTALGS